jgi:hypothetical protein
MKHLFLTLLPFFAFGQTDSIPFAPPPPPPLRIKEISNIVQKQEKLLVVLSQPNDKKRAKHYRNYWNDYIESHPNDQDLEGKKPIYYYFFYLVNKFDDAHWLKKNNIPSDKNVYAVCDYDGEVMYYKEATIPKMHRKKLFYDDTEAEVRTTATARLIDKVLTNPQAPIEDVEKAFHKMVTNNYDLQLQKVENYTLKLTPEQLRWQWKRLVDAHYHDRKIDEEYTRLLIRNYTTFYNQNFLQIIFHTEYIPDATDLKAMAYFIKFYEEAVKIPDTERLFLYRYDLYEFFQKLTTAHRELLPDIEIVTAEAKRKEIID